MFRIILLIFLAPQILLAQDDVPKIENGRVLQQNDLSAALKQLYSKSDFLIRFTTKYPNPINQGGYFVFVSKKGVNSLHLYNLETDGLKKLNIPKQALELAYTTFVQNDLFTMKDEKDIANFCAEKYKLYSAFSYQFVVVAGDQIKNLSYDDPEYYDVACFGMVERRKIINSAAIFNYMVAEISKSR